MQKLKNKTSAGLTLMEILVVIAILSVLSTMAIVALNNARSKARDDIRMADLQNIRIALNLFHAESGQYPINEFIIFGLNKSANSLNTQGNWAHLDNFLTTINLPKDPLNRASHSDPMPWDGDLVYWYASDGDNYDLIALLENEHPDSCPNKQQLIHYMTPGLDWCTFGYSIITDH